MHQLHCNQNPSSYLSQNVFSERLQVSQGVYIVDLASERLLLKWVNLGTSRHIETLALKIKMTIDPTVLHSWNCWKTYTDVLLDKFYIFLVLTIFGSLLTCLIRWWQEKQGGVYRGDQWTSAGDVGKTQLIKEQHFLLSVLFWSTSFETKSLWSSQGLFDIEPLGPCNWAKPRKTEFITIVVTDHPTADGVASWSDNLGLHQQS